MIAWWRKIIRMRAMTSRSTKLVIVAWVSLAAAPSAVAGEIKGFLRYDRVGCYLVRHAGTNREATVRLNREFCDAYRGLNGGFLAVMVYRMPCESGKREFCGWARYGRFAVYDPLKETVGR